MFTGISCIEPQASSAKAMLWPLWKTCRFAICPARPKGRRKILGSVRAESGLNRAILDQGWFGDQLFAVSPQNRYCPECRHIAKENRQAQASFVCMQCGFAENADFVGALNVSRAGVARLACAVSDVVCHVARRPGTHRSDSGALSCS